MTIGDDGLIAAIDAASNQEADRDFSGLWIVPGFIDIHVHGGGGADFMDATPDAVRQVARTHARHGTTTLLATTLTAEREQIDRCIASVREVMDSPGPGEARIVGIHLEGPYISAAKRGAQPQAFIRPPDWDEMERWISLSGGAIKLVTIAPEIDGALDFIRRAAAAGVVVSIGHTSATVKEARAGIDAGARNATHLFNAMPPLAHRAPGAAAALLESDDVSVELIADGVHLHPAIAGIVSKIKGPGRIILITDAMAGAAMPDGEYSLGGSPVTVQSGTASFSDGTLAGSVLTMNQAFHNIRRFAGTIPSDAAAMTSLNAARLIGIDVWTGRLEVDFRADLAVIDPQTGAVEAAMRDGRWLW